MDGGDFRGRVVEGHEGGVLGPEGGIRGPLAGVREGGGGAGVGDVAAAAVAAAGGADDGAVSAAAAAAAAGGAVVVTAAAGEVDDLTDLEGGGVDAWVGGLEGVEGDAEFLADGPEGVAGLDGVAHLCFRRRGVNTKLWYRVDEVVCMCALLSAGEYVELCIVLFRKWHVG